jgi:glycosyltransferase involved in cell wall biosynthesis
MQKLPLISVITPCLNAARFIEEAIGSVLAQGYPPFEHIVIDGGSPDGTLDILRRYPHLRWVSEADRGQADAMNKGFAAAKGEIVVYLNADDYFEPNAFNAVAAAFDRGANLVMGRVQVLRSDGTGFLNDPKTELANMLRWWMPDAFCVNSGGYFFRRWVLESVGPFAVEDYYHMDYEFLIEARRRCAFTRIPDLLVNFRFIPGTKTFKNSANEPDTMRRFEKYLTLLDAAEREKYLEEYASFLKEWETTRKRV